MRIYFVVLGQTVDFDCVQVDKEVVVVRDAVLEGRRGEAFALEILPANQAPIDVVVRKRNAADLFHVEV